MKSPRLGCLRALCALFLLVVLLAAAGYVLRGRLIPAAQDRIRGQLEKKRVFVDYTLGGDLRPHAVTLRNLTFYRTSERKEPAATLDHLTLRISLLNSLLHRAPEVVASTRDGTLVILGADQPVIWEHLNLTYHHGARSRSVEQLQATVRGVDLDLGARWQVLDKQESPPPAAPASPGATAPGTAASPATPPPGAGAATPVQPAVSPQPGEPQVSRLDLSALVKLAEALDYRNAGFQPGLAIQATGKPAPDGSLAWTLSGKTRSLPSQGVDLDLQASWATSEDDVTTLSELKLSHGPTGALLRGTYREAEETFEISHCESALDWTAILRDAPALRDKLAPIRTISPPRLTLSGRHHLGQPEKSSLAFTLAGWGLDHQGSSGRPPLEIRDLQAQGTLREGTLQIPSFQAAVAGGAVSGEATMSPFAEDLPWRGRLEARDLPLARLVKPTAQVPAEGIVGLTFAGSGSSAPKTLQGEGKLGITNGRFIDVEVFGSLLRFLGRLSPTLGAGSADQVAGNFVIRDGIMRTEDLLLEVSASKIAVKGQVDLTTRLTNLVAQANLRGLLSGITESFTEGRGLVIEGSGPVDDIDWKLRKPGTPATLPDSGTPPGTGPAPAAPDAPAPPAPGTGSLKDQIKQQAVDSLLDGTAGEAVGTLLKGIKERRALRRQEREPGAAAP